MALVWALAYRDIRISSRVGVVIECLSVTIIILMAIVHLTYRFDLATLARHCERGYLFLDEQPAKFSP